MKVLIIYQFCTFGGVERAILNRVQAYRRYGLNTEVSVGYLQKDEALGSFQEYIRAHGLQDSLEAFILPQGTAFDWAKFDMVSIIDTPQVFDRIGDADNIFIECHTAYIQNRQYLKTLPKNIRGVLAPSHPFREQLLQEFPGLPTISVLPNPVSEEFFPTESVAGARIFPRQPLTYFARLDELKNFTEAVDIFASLGEEERAMFFVVGYGSDDRGLIEMLNEKMILDRSLLRGRIGFNDAPYLTRLVRDHRGIFLSPSKGESFGLSAAEFICAGVPVLLTNIPAHKELVQGDKRFLYELGDILSAKKKLQAIWKDWEAMSQIMASYAEKLRGEAFYTAWVRFLKEQKLNPKTGQGS